MMKGFFGGLGTMLGGIGKGIGEAVSGVVGGLVESIEMIPSLITGTLEGIGKAITTTMSGVVGVLGKIGGLGYKSVKTVVKDMWKGMGAVAGAAGTGIVSVRDFFQGKMNDTTKDGKRISYVRVLGGHIDTVGAVGAVDRDAYVKEWKANYRQVGGRSMETGRLSGRSSVRSGKMYNDIDKEQDNTAGVQDKQTDLLERIAEKGGSTIVNGGSSDKAGTNWMDILKGLTPLILGLGYLLKKFMNTGETTPDGHPMGPEKYKGAWDAMTSKANPFHLGHAIGGAKYLGKKALSLGAKVIKPFKTAGQGIAKGWRTATNGIKGGKATMKGAVDYVSHTKLGGKLGLSTAEAASVRSGQLVKSGDSFFKSLGNGMIEKTTMVMDDAGKMVPQVSTFMDDVAKKSAEKAAAAAAKGTTGAGKGILGKVLPKLKSGAADLVKSWGSKAASYIKNMILKVVQSTGVKKMFGENISNTIAKNIDNFALKVVESPSVKNGLLKNAGKVLSGLAKWVPVLNAAMFLYDLYAGWRDADKYFSIPEFKLTTRMRVTGALTRAFQGLVALIPWLIPIAFIPTEYLVSAIWALTGADAEKKELDKTKAEYAKQYDAYHKAQQDAGKKAKTYDDWIRDVGDTQKNQTKLAKYGGIGFISNTNKQLNSKAMADANMKDPNFMNKTSSIGMNYTAGGSGGATNTVFGAGASSYAAGNIFRPISSPGGAGLGIPGMGAVPTSDGSVSFSAADYQALRQLLGSPKNPLASMEVTSHPLLYRKSSKRPHKGVDLAAAAGTNVYAIGAGKVTVSYAPYNNGANFGHYIVIEHGGGYISRYAHLSKVLVKNGDTVKAGDLIGKSGFSGMSAGDKTGSPHLHFEIRKGRDQKSPVGNPETFLNIGKVRNGIESGAVFGSGKSEGYDGSMKKMEGLNSMYTKMYSQNTDFNMSVGGDKMSLQQVGCGPVTTNLFLQDAGVREPLLKTLRSLKTKRKKDDGFSPEMLSSYITSKGVGNKIIKASKSDIAKASFGIAFANRNSAINSLDENHAIYIKHISEQGVILYDPFFETTKYASWDMLLKSVFNIIIPTGKSEISNSVRGGSESKLIEAGKMAKTLDDSKHYQGVLDKAKAISASKRRDKKIADEKASKTNTSPKASNTPVTQQTSTHDNIMIDIMKGMSVKMDAMINILAEIAKGNVTKPEVVNGINGTIDKMLRSLQNDISGGKSGSSGNDPWLLNRNHISKGGR